MIFNNQEITEYDWDRVIENNTEEVESRKTNIFKYGIPSDNERIKDKNLLTYSAMVIQSHWDSGDIDGRRYVYYNKLNKEEMSDVMKVSMRTINRNISALIKTGLLETIETPNGVAYKFNYKKDNGQYVQIENDIMKELVHTSTNVVATYVLMKYHLKDGIKKMTQEYIAEEIGLSKSSRKLIEPITKMLAKLGLIIIHRKFEKETIKMDNGQIKVIPKECLYYELVEHEDWMNLNKLIVREK